MEVTHETLAVDGRLRVRRDGGLLGLDGGEFLSMTDPPGETPMADRSLQKTLAPQLMRTWLSDLPEVTRQEMTDLWLDHITREDLCILRTRLEAFLTYMAPRCV
jgi:hypothetical protein